MNKYIDLDVALIKDTFQLEDNRLIRTRTNLLLLTIREKTQRTVSRSGSKADETTLLPL